MRRGHYFVSLSKAFYPLLCTGSTQEDRKSSENDENEFIHKLADQLLKAYIFYDICAEAKSKKRRNLIYNMNPYCRPHPSCKFSVPPISVF